MVNYFPLPGGGEEKRGGGLPSVGRGQLALLLTGGRDVGGETPMTSDSGAGCYGWLLEQKRQKLAKERGSSW